MGLWRALSELNEPAWDSKLVRCRFGPSERPPKIAEGAIIPNRDAERAAAESGGELSAQLIDHLKKSKMANEAKCLFDGSGWPEPLRLAEVALAPAAWVSMARKPAYRAVYQAGPTSTAHGGSGHEQVTLRLHRLFLCDRRGNRSSA